jgi:isopentenyl-diphosphate Delta-isomerase
MASVILVDDHDNTIGAAEKMQAHQDGLLHRAFSVFLFDDEGNILLQRRAMNKYHSPGLWSNACCSHPETGEDTLAAAQRRLLEEMGINDCILVRRFAFTYRVDFADGLIENEYDHVFTGTFNGDPEPDPSEVMDWKWMSVPELKTDIVVNPERYTYWIKEVLGKVLEVDLGSQ